MKSTAEVVRVGEAFAWIENQRSIAIQASTRDGKPVELDAEQAKQFADRVAKLADVLRSLQAQADES